MIFEDNGQIPTGGNADSHVASITGTADHRVAAQQLIRFVR
ncbi:MAG: hypothetical protein V3T92_02380 [Anaerolineae bacterium]